MLGLSWAMPNIRRRGERQALGCAPRLEALPHLADAARSVRADVAHVRDARRGEGAQLDVFDSHGSRTLHPSFVRSGGPGDVAFCEGWGAIARGGTGGAQEVAGSCSRGVRRRAGIPGLACVLAASCGGSGAPAKDGGPGGAAGGGGAAGTGGPAGGAPGIAGRGGTGGMAGAGGVASVECPGCPFVILPVAARDVVYGTTQSHLRLRLGRGGRLPQHDRRRRSDGVGCRRHHPDGVESGGAGAFGRRVDVVGRHRRGVRDAQGDADGDAWWSVRCAGCHWRTTRSTTSRR